MADKIATKHHPLRAVPLARGRHPKAPHAPKWPSYQGRSEFVGITPSGRLAVWVDPSLGSQGLQNAHDLVADGDRVMNANDQIFGKRGGNVYVIVFAVNGATDGTGGADHMGCTYNVDAGGAIEVCASFGNSARVSALFEAELSECAMNGQLCGLSSGEALSRWCSAVVGNNALADFATAPAWFQDGMPNYVDTTDATDQNADSTGCGMAFISWLMNGFGAASQSLDKIAPVMVQFGDSGTLAQLYEQLTGNSASEAWSKFSAAVNALPNGVNDDDPFGALTSKRMRKAAT